VRDLKITVRSCGLVEVYHAPQYTEVGTNFLTIDFARSKYKLLNTVVINATQRGQVELCVCVCVCVCVCIGSDALCERFVNKANDNVCAAFTLF
jgi:hypothetical protein